MIDLTAKSSSYQAIIRQKSKMVFESKFEVLTKVIPKKKKKKNKERIKKGFFIGIWMVLP